MAIVDVDPRKETVREKIFIAVENCFGINEHELKDKVKIREITNRRFIVWGVLADYGYSPSEIVEVFDGRFDRVTISKGISQCELYIQHETQFRKRYLRLADEMEKLTGFEAEGQAE
ncbi:MAG: hypothetical protein HUU10_04390 [Bacteroidetes bacterium]|nr:hypothetical protein [Bacteroidota bacterium]